MTIDIGLLLLRLFSGLMMAFAHGHSKLMGFSELAGKFPDPLGIGSQFSLGLTVFSEVGCAVFLAMGLFTRWVAVPLLITMLVAAFIVHAADPWAKQEFALLYGVCYLTLMFTGAGRLSIDQLINKKS
jgi:putative oxidoreductase